MTQHNPTQRSGTTLIELVVVMTVQTAILGLAIALLSLLITTEKQGRRDVERGMAYDALSDRFRRDAHAAESAETNATSHELRLASDWRVTYQSTEEGIQRLEFFGEAIAARELFRLPIGYQSQFESEQVSGVTLLRLRLKPAAAADGKPSSAAWQCEAVVGRDLKR